MPLITTKGELRKVKRRKRGFLVNVTEDEIAKVHHLGYLCWNARKQIRVPSGYPTYFIEMREGLAEHPWGNESWEDCPKCLQERDKLNR